MMRLNYIIIGLIIASMIVPLSSIAWNDTYLSDTQHKVDSYDSYYWDYNSVMYYDDSEQILYNNGNALLENAQPGYYYRYEPTAQHIFKIKISDNSVVWSAGIATAGSNIWGIDDEYNVYVASGSLVYKIDHDDGIINWAYDVGHTVLHLSTSSNYLAVASEYEIHIVNNGNGNRSGDYHTCLSAINDITWSYDGSLIVADGNYCRAYDVGYWTVDTQIWNNSAVQSFYVTYETFSSVNGVIEYQYVFIVHANSKLSCLWSGNDTTIPELIWTYESGQYICSNVVYSKDVDQIAFTRLESGIPSSGPPMIISTLTWNGTHDADPIVKWNSTTYDNSYYAYAKIISDRSGNIVFSRWGFSYLVWLTPTIGNEEQKLTLKHNGSGIVSYSYSDVKNFIYDGSQDTILMYNVLDSTPFIGYLQTIRFNGTYVNDGSGGGDEDPIFPGEITEDTWTWLFFTFCIISLAALCALIDGYMLNGSIFMMVLGVLISIGAWYGIYPVEAMLLAVLCLFGVFLSTRGGQYE